ncbi:hypothetical protein PR048_016102 [Dryococelus australis]|uniref:C2H2-type domain-containing protein n=1 Tax=Dryococelus australis TaxID=614101 RepID=A0ABQ9HJ74_9NEOP|nr:hypothetical protein PR048_016102 [Dryococelus australis]
MLQTVNFCCRKHANKEIDNKGRPMSHKDFMQHLSTARSKALASTSGKPSDVICDVCSQEFRTVTAAIQHKFRKHPANIAKHFCPHCGMQFPLKDNCDRHVATHREEADHSSTCSCPDCGVVFYNKMALDYHFKSTHKRYVKDTALVDYTWGVGSGSNCVRANPLRLKERELDAKEAGIAAVKDWAAMASVWGHDYLPKCTYSCTIVKKGESKTRIDMIKPFPIGKSSKLVETLRNAIGDSRRDSHPYSCVSRPTARTAISTAVTSGRVLKLPAKGARNPGSSVMAPTPFSLFCANIRNSTSRVKAGSNRSVDSPQNTAVRWFANFTCFSTSGLPPVSPPRSLAAPSRDARSHLQLSHPGSRCTRPSATGARARVENSALTFVVLAWFNGKDACQIPRVRPAHILSGSLSLLSVTIMSLGPSPRPRLLGPNSLTLKESTSPPPVRIVTIWHDCSLLRGIPTGHELHTITALFQPVATPPPSKKIRMNNAGEAQSVYYCHLCGYEYIVKFNLQKHLERQHTQKERDSVPIKFAYVACEEGSGAAHADCHRVDVSRWWVDQEEIGAPLPLFSDRKGVWLCGRGLMMGREKECSGVGVAGGWKEEGREAVWAGWLMGRDERQQVEDRLFKGGGDKENEGSLQILKECHVIAVLCCRDMIKCTTCDALFYNKKAYDNHNMYHKPEDLYVTSEEQR